MSEARVVASPERPYESARPIAAAAHSGALILAALAAVKFFLQLAGVNRYGFFRDELYYMACGEHLAWGYVDQPPLIAFVAWFERHLFGHSLFAARILPILAGAAVIWLTGILARDLGGGLLAQFIAAMAMLFAPAYLAFDSFLSMNAFEPLLWALCAWLVLHIAQGGSPKLWLVFGLVAGIGIENKHSMLLFGFALAVGLALSPERRMFRSRWIWFGAALALLIFLPNLLWEATHGWPQIQVVRNAQEFKNVPISPLRFIVEQILFLHPLAFPLWLGGLGWYLFSPAGKRYRYFGWAYLVVLTIFIVLHGKTYYPLPVYPLLMAAGGVAFESFTSAANLRWARLAYPLLLLIGGAAAVPYGVPVLPIGSFLRYSGGLPDQFRVKTERDPTVALPQLYADMFGWEDMAGTISSVYHALPPAERAGCAIVGGNYGEAGAIDYYGPALGLPKAISGHNSYYYWGPRNYTGSCVIMFGERSTELSALFKDVQRVATISNPHAMLVEQNVPVYLCREPVAPLAILWPHFKMII